jgi:hypothetical protein
MGTRLGNLTKIGNIHSTLKARLVGSIKNRIQRNVLEDLVEPHLVRIEHHLCGVITKSKTETGLKQAMSIFQGQSQQRCEKVDLSTGTN